MAAFLWRLFTSFFISDLFLIYFKEKVSFFALTHIWSSNFISCPQGKSAVSCIASLVIDMRL